MESIPRSGRIPGWEHHELGAVFVLMGASVFLFVLGVGLIVHSLRRRLGIAGLVWATVMSTGLFWLFGLDVL